MINWIKILIIPFTEATKD